MICAWKLMFDDINWKRVSFLSKTYLTDLIKISIGHIYHLNTANKKKCVHWCLRIFRRLLTQESCTVDTYKCCLFFLFMNMVFNQRLLKETTLISIGTELPLKEFQTIDHGSIKLQNKWYHFALQNTLLFNFWILFTAQ